MEIHTVLAASTAALELAVAIVLVRKYMRTKDVRFVWFALAFAIWPLASRLLEFGVRPLVDQAVRHNHVGLFPFNLVESGQITLGQVVTYMDVTAQIVQLCLLLVALFYVFKEEPTTSGVTRVA
jgi:hypothetical protein